MTPLETRRVVLRTVIDSAREYEVSAQDILGESRTRSIAQARQVVFYRLHTSGFSLSQIGRLLQRDHSTVLHGVRKVAAGMAA